MKISRLMSLIGIFVLVMALTTPAFALTKPDVAGDGDPGPAWPTGQPTLFLPLIRNVIYSHTVSGQIKDAGDAPLAQAVVQGEFGQSATTDVNGVYKMPAVDGNQKIVASKDGFDFEPAVAEVNVTEDMNSLNFTALSVNAPTVTGCTNLLLNSNFEGTGGWVTTTNSGNPQLITPTLQTTTWFSPVSSMLAGVPPGTAYPHPAGTRSSSEFWQPITMTIPLTATFVEVRMHVLPRSSFLWGYNIAGQKAMDELVKLNMADAQEGQYAHIRDATNTTTLRQLFKWTPISSFFWLYRAYNLWEFRGQTISVLFGAMNDGYDGNTALYVDDVYMYYCTP
jgi:hypothetical protein